MDQITKNKFNDILEKISNTSIHDAEKYWDNVEEKYYSDTKECTDKIYLNGNYFDDKQNSNKTIAKPKNALTVEQLQEKEKELKQKEASLRKEQLAFKEDLEKLKSERKKIEEEKAQLAKEREELQTLRKTMEEKELEKPENKVAVEAME